MTNVTVLGAGAWGTTFGQVLADAGNNVTMWAIEPEIVEGIRNGSIAGTSAQQPVLMGRNAAQAIVDHLAGKEVEKEITMDTMLVTKDNIDDVYDTLVEVALDDGEAK